MKVHVEAPSTARLERLVGDYRQWLVSERSLAANTVRYYVAGARLFLCRVRGAGPEVVDVGGGDGVHGPPLPALERG